ncbi:hypothetical protein ODJ79_14460 [Actinoplanes sp. KI2]|uniref:hypothetical protein n=1 Tax=Actinoplanes sp. KI2 TaxID=2983315 RepID=UPI0021D5B354|nr:hypothetical protein [Actinoplanes sp. KI2]MCU7724926.1 hypothetical protein [Actinoplanes sp. KI2]
MTANSARMRICEALEGISAVRFVRTADVDVEDACRRFRSEGYEVTDWLRSFIRDYSGLTVGWKGVRGGDNEFSTAVEDALDAFLPNIRIYSRRLGCLALPIGVAFATEERMLLSEFDDVILGGDAGLQRVGKGFEASMCALVTGQWDKTFF